MSHCSMHSPRVRQRGFTLAEILVTTAVFAIIMLAALAVYDQSNRTFKTSTEAADMQQSTRVGFEKLVSDLRMAGFDYSRGGTPNNDYQVPQPDEQVEYAGSSAVVFRANFNYNTANGACAAVGSGSLTACNNGVEQGLEPANVQGQAIFPYVTTANNEIVAYVLHSTTNNPSSIAFYADDYTPREVFPSSVVPAPAGSNPSKKEALITISGIDTTGANPPYTLYRVTLADSNCNGACTINVGSVGTPVAENIRDINFKYYTDAQGTTLLTGPAPGNAAITDGAIGGDGQYDPNAPNFVGAGSFADRGQRAQIQSIRVTLTGLNASPDLQGYTNPTETVTSVQKYRQYQLSSLIVPRNLGRTGFPEQTSDPPSPPQIVGLCTGHCGAPVIAWQAPSGGPPVVKFVIEWDTNSAFTNPHTFNVTDPAATSAILPDDGIQDVSQLYYYRIAAQNENGESAWSPSGISTWTARPKNATKPSPPSNFVATDRSLGTAQPNQITLTWNGPTTNDASANTLTCSGTGTAAATNIPAGEVIKYRVWRGTRPDFDPRSSCSSGPQCGGVAVLRASSGSQPSGATPGSQLTWIDNTIDENLGGQAPAGCTQYYYRIQAVDRCVMNANYETTGNVATSESDFFPPINGSSNAVAGSAADSGTTPSQPIALQVDTSTNASGCPDPVNGGQYCKITLMWAPVTSDTAGNAIGVDTYRITRKFKHQNNLPTNVYALDPSFGTNGTLDVSGFSQQAPNAATGKISWVDTTAPVSEPNPPFTGVAMAYEYTIAAKTCSTYSAESDFVDYPTPCSVNPTIIQAGATNPTATGDTPATAWIMNAGDTITVTPPSGVTFSSVNFTITTYPTGAPVDNQTLSAPPYVYSWSDRSDGQLYTVVITVIELTPTAGCRESHVKYVQDQAPAACAFANVSPIPLSQSTSGSTTTASSAFTLTNNGTDPLQFNVATPFFQGTAKENWTGPTLAEPTLTATSLVWSSGAFNTSDNFSITTTPFTRSIPATMPTVCPNPAGSCVGSNSFTVTARFQYKKNSPTLTGSPLTKLCIAYRIQSEPGVTKFCNVAGQANPTNNPNACD